MLIAVSHCLFFLFLFWSGFTVSPCPCGIPFLCPCMINYLVIKDIWCRSKGREPIGLKQYRLGYICWSMGMIDELNYTWLFELMFKKHVLFVAIWKKKHIINTNKKWELPHRHRKCSKGPKGYKKHKHIPHQHSYYLSITSLSSLVGNSLVGSSETNDKGLK